MRQIQRDNEAMAGGDETVSEEDDPDDEINVNFDNIANRMPALPAASVYDRYEQEGRTVEGKTLQLYREYRDSPIIGSMA